MSQPRVPLPEMTNGCEAGLVVWKSLRRRVRVSPKTLTKAGPTCDSLEGSCVSHCVVKVFFFPLVFFHPLSSPSRRGTHP